MSELKKFIMLLEDFPALRVVDEYQGGDIEIDLSEEEMKYYDEIMDKYGDLYLFLKKKIKDSGEDPEDYGID